MSIETIGYRNAHKKFDFRPKGGWHQRLCDSVDDLTRRFSRFDDMPSWTDIREGLLRYDCLKAELKITRNALSPEDVNELR